jgi:hypothetical protein
MRIILMLLAILAAPAHAELYLTDMDGHAVRDGSGGCIECVSGSSIAECNEAMANLVSAMSNNPVSAVKESLPIICPLSEPLIQPSCPSAPPTVITRIIHDKVACPVAEPAIAPVEHVAPVVETESVTSPIDIERRGYEVGYATARARYMGAECVKLPPQVITRIIHDKVACPVAEPAIAPVERHEPTACPEPVKQTECKQEIKQVDLFVIALICFVIGIVGARLSKS